MWDLSSCYISYLWLFVHLFEGGGVERFQTVGSQSPLELLHNLLSTLDRAIPSMFDEAAAGQWGEGRRPGAYVLITARLCKESAALPNATEVRSPGTNERWQIWREISRDKHMHRCAFLWYATIGEESVGFLYQMLSWYYFLGIRKKVKVYNMFVYICSLYLIENACSFQLWVTS